MADPKEQRDSTQPRHTERAASTAAVASGSVSHFVWPADKDVARLDKALAELLPSISRSRCQTLIREGHVTISGETVYDPKQRLLPGAQVTMRLPEPKPAAPQPEPISLAVVYEDDYVIVIDKPAGLVVHPGAGHADGTLVNALIAHCGASLSGIGGIRRPGIVHRLDRDTSGLLVVAKTDAAHQSLSEQFAAHGRDGRLQRRYIAFVWGTFDRPTGTVEARLARSIANRTRIAVVRGEQGRHAVTHFRVVGEALGQGKAAISVVEVELETGRTHQIRVHFSHIRHPVVGDQTYGASHQTMARGFSVAVQEAIAALGRQALHACHLGFVHPKSGECLAFDAPLPADMQVLADLLGVELTDF